MNRIQRESFISAKSKLDGHTVAGWMFDRRWRCVSLLVLSAHIVLVIRHGAMVGPTVDEPGHLAAGVHYWATGDFSLYCVNPPLVKLWGTIPAFLMAEKQPRIEISGAFRPEWPIGHAFFKDNVNSLWYLRMARWLNLPFSILAAIVIAKWARRMGGEAASTTAMSLWCLSPTVIGHASLFTMDVPAAGMGVIALLGLDRWLEREPGFGTLQTGLLVGLALLTKLTWMILVVVILAIIIFRQLMSQLDKKRIASVGLLCVTAWVVLNSGYLWSGVFLPMHSVSDMLDGNQFGYLYAIPVPLAHDFVVGALQQRHDLLHAQLDFSIWNYPVLIAMKTPIGTWLLILFSCLGLAKRCGRCEWQRVARANPVLLLSSGLLVLAISRSTICEIRYLLPLFPAGAILLVTITLRAWPQAHTTIFLTAIALNVTELASSFPYHLGFFNLAVGGPMNTNHDFSGGNVDWGQDIPQLDEWARSTQPRPIAVACISGLPMASERYVDVSESMPEDWDELSVFVVSTTFLHSDGWRLAGRHHGRPTRRIGSSLFVFTREVLP